MREGVLAFPATPFTSRDEVDVNALEAHIRFLVDGSPVALVPCGAAGEMFSLTLEEYAEAIAATVRAANGAIPVIAGIGHGTGIACQMAREAERLGADAILVLPPYLVQSEQAGLQQHLRRICDAVSIAVIVYNRDNCLLGLEAIRRLADECPNFLGVKDGACDFELVDGMRAAFGDEIVIINGAPTAELFARRYRDHGVHAFSSAVFSFQPMIAKTFLSNLLADDMSGTGRLLDGFYRPLQEVRKRKRGYSVSIIKAGLKASGRPAGGVRPPLVDCTDDEVKEIARLIERMLPELALPATVRQDT